MEVQVAAKVVPEERILCETDAPFLTPVPHRGKSNRPEYVRHTVNFIAELKGVKDLQTVIFNNSKRFFNL